MKSASLFCPPSTAGLAIRGLDRIVIGTVPAGHSLQRELDRDACRCERRRRPVRRDAIWLPSSAAPAKPAGRPQEISSRQGTWAVIVTKL